MEPIQAGMHLIGRICSGSWSLSARDSLLRECRVSFHGSQTGSTDATLVDLGCRDDSFPSSSNGILRFAKTIPWPGRMYLLVCRYLNYIVLILLYMPTKQVVTYYHDYQEIARLGSRQKSHHLLAGTSRHPTATASRPHTREPRCPMRAGEPARSGA